MPETTPPARVAPQTLGLCMIVKNETKVIERCLDSVRPLVDYMLIVDTGSTDGTQALVRAYLDRHRMPGEVFEDPWQDFAYNRSRMLARLRLVPWVEYALIIDADDRLVIDDGFDIAGFKAGLTADLYYMEVTLNSIRYFRGQICRNRLEFRYRGVLHEFLDGPPGGYSSDHASGLRIQSGRDGARSQDPDKYRRDAEVLEQALRVETDPFMRSRYTFYLAQSYRDAGEAEPAAAYYLRRAELGFWAEEIYISLYCAARLLGALGRPNDEVIATFARASATVSTRAEAHHAAAQYCRNDGRYQQGYDIAKRGLQFPEPSESLFGESWIYQYGLLDEFAVNAYWAGHYHESLSACVEIFCRDQLPDRERLRVAANARFALEKLPVAGWHWGRESSATKEIGNV